VPPAPGSCHNPEVGDDISPGAGEGAALGSPVRRPLDPEPPVVARLVVEIRSDGSLTIARGALEDATTGERTTIEARGTTPLALAASLARAMTEIPALVRRAVRALLPRGRS
jgi:hypothetical protein